LAGNPVEIVTTGRHDPCVGLRATPIAEAMLAIVLMDHYLRHRAQNADVRSTTPNITERKRGAIEGALCRPAAGNRPWERRPRREYGAPEQPATRRDRTSQEPSARETRATQSRRQQGPQGDPGAAAREHQ